MATTVAMVGGIRGVKNDDFNCRFRICHWSYSNNRYLSLELLFFPLNIFSIAMLLASYLMYAFEFGKVVEGCIQYFAGGLILAVGKFSTYLLFNLTCLTHSPISMP
jgi:hypothetical protein